MIAPDLRGHGESGEEPPWLRETHAADVTETVEVVGADWLGYSFGGLVCCTLAASAPERIQRLVLLEPALGLRPSTCLGYARAELRDQSYATEEEAIADMESGGMFFHAPREMLEEEARLNLVRGEDGRLRYRYSRLAAIGAWNEMAREAPPVADVPTLIVVGDRSPLHVDASRFPGAQVVTVSGGHSVLWDAFEETAAAVERFLAS
ncbi:MAG: lipase [Solirubrobacteraceae bacterium]|nr:lipase [Solirubrobacteraceae bacterium]